MGSSIKNDAVNKEIVDQNLLSIDEQLNLLVSGIDILSAVKPLNYLDQKKAFFENKFSIEPNFTYQEQKIDTFAIKRKLYNLPIESLKDEDLYVLYKSVIDSYVDKIDQFKSIGSNEFLYDSLRYYGEPSEKDIRNARFVLHLPDNTGGADNDSLLDARQINEILSEMVAQENYDWVPVFDDTMIANALVSGINVRINSSARLSPVDARALAHHELGVHLATSLNGRKQVLRILSLGCPINTTTQEGLAILSEYLSGNLTIKRLKILALRVVAVESMINDKNFRTTFLMLKEQYRVEDELAFTITARVYRGGGFTKDYLYLTGFSQMLSAYEHEASFNNLLAGKTSLPCLPLITRLIEKNVLQAPVFITPAFRSPVENDAVKTFITHSIR